MGTEMFLVFSQLLRVLLVTFWNMGSIEHLPTFQLHIQKKKFWLPIMLIVSFTNSSAILVVIKRKKETEI